MESEMSLLVGVYGSSGCGKTRFVEELVTRVTGRGYSCRGVCSPAIFEGGLKTGILARLIPGRESKVLAKLAQEGDDHILGKWRIYPETFAWTLDYLQEETYSDLWIIDELGPYEVERGLGWAPILLRLENLPGKVILITYRPNLDIYFTKRYPNILTFDLERDNAAEKATREIEGLLFVE